MIEFIHIKGFQSHLNTRIDFSSNMTALVGKSMDGKTAILRAFEFVRKNRPSGFKFSYRYEELITSVSIGVDGHVIIHKKANTPLNKEGHKALYIIRYPDETEKEFSAYGTNVPDQVSDILNISDISIQSQLDPYMLILSTAGQIAATINKITGIDVSDKWIKEINKSLKELKAEVTVLNKSQEKLKEDIEKYTGVDEIKIKISKAQELDWEYNKIIKDANSILDLINVNSATESKKKVILSQLNSLSGLTKAIALKDKEIAEISKNNSLSSNYLRSKELNEINKMHYDAIYPKISILSEIEKEIKDIKGIIELKNFYNNQELMMVTCEEELKIEKDNLAKILVEFGKCYVCGSELNDWGKIRKSI